YKSASVRGKGTSKGRTVSDERKTGKRSFRLRVRFVLRRCLRRSKSARGGKYLRSTEGFEKVLCSSDRFRSAFHQQPTEQCDADQEAAVLHGGHPAPLF